MIEIKNLCKNYGDKEVIKNISLKIENGEVVSLLGNNGSGKTTTFKMIASLCEASHGQILYNDETIDHESVSYLPEERSLFLDCSVYDHLKLVAELNKSVDIENRINRQLEYFKIEKYRNEKISNLSKGNQQKVALAVCLIKNAPIVILDEPFTGLDSDNVGLFMQCIKALKYHGKTVLLSSHLYQPIASICDRFLYLYNGKIKYNITKKALFDDKRRIIETDQDLSNQEGVIKKYCVNDKWRYVILSESIAQIIVCSLNCDYVYRKLTFEDILYIGQDR